MEFPGTEGGDLGRRSGIMRWPCIRMIPSNRPGRIGQKLRKFTEALEDKRKEIKRKYLEPYEQV